MHENKDIAVVLFAIQFYEFKYLFIFSIFSLLLTKQIKDTYHWCNSLLMCTTFFLRMTIACVSTFCLLQTKNKTKIKRAKKEFVQPSATPLSFNENKNKSSCIVIYLIRRHIFCLFYFKFHLCARHQTQITQKSNGFI